MQRAAAGPYGFQRPPATTIAKIKDLTDADALKLGFAPFAAPAKIGASGVLVVFCDDGLKFGPATAKALGAAAGLVARAAKAERFTGKNGSALELVVPEGLKVARLVVIGAGKPASLKPKDLLKLGGLAMGKVPIAASEATVFAELPGGALKAEQAADLALGVALRAYAFDRYKTKRKDDEKPPAKRSVTIAVGDVAAARKAYATREAIGDGVLMARDLVNEPANVLYPEEFARRAGALRKLGVAVEVLDVKAMKKLGMNALLGVGQGSARESRVVVMRWNGGKAGDAPVAFIGKGVCFDTGGISIKPAAGMEDMKGDMAGAACVVGLMHALAARKAQGQRGRRHRPGREHAGRQCAASGRHRHLDVRADHRDHQYRRRGPPRARRRDLVHGQAFQAEIHGRSGDADRRDHRRARAGICRHVRQRRQAGRAADQGGEATGELVWRMPLAPEYDKMIDSKFADMKNTGGRAGAARSPRRNSSSASSTTRRRGRISTSPAPAWTRARPTSTRAGARAGACGCSTGWWRIITSGEGASAMTEVLFYHLQGQKLEGVLPALLEKSLERGWKVVVQGASEERIEALDAHLWTYRDDGFLPHGTWREPEAAAQPVLLTVNDGNPKRRRCVS